MTWWHRLFHRSKKEEELERELRFHLDQHEADLIAQGLNPAEARRQARIALGGPEQVKEMCRDARGTRWLMDLLQDLRYGARMLFRQPGFTLIAVLTLALGIGASTAIFSAVNPILFEPLPYPQASRVLMISDFGPNNAPADVTYGTYRELVERSRSCEALAVVKPWQPIITDPAERLDGQFVSADYFRTLGIRPSLGRDFESADDRLNSPKVAILSYGLWQRRFGSDQTIIGCQIMLDDEGYTVIGVMPKRFENVLSTSAEMWTPLQYDMSMGRAWGHHLRMVGRLRSDIRTDQVKQEFDQIARNPVSEFARPAWASLRNGLIVNLLQDEVTRGVKPALLAVLGAVLLLLLIACVNVTNLLLARGAQRSGEFAVRTALGASRTRMIRQLLTESLLLAILGGVLGIVVAEFGVEALVALSPPEIPRLTAISLDGTVFAFAMGITTLIGLVIGVIPALHAARGELGNALQKGSKRTVAGQHLTRRVLVVAEVALALVLLVSAGLLLRSLQSLFAISPGFDASHLLTLQVQTSAQRFDKAATERFFAQALESVRQVPGVTAAAFTSQLPMSSDKDEYGAHFEGDDANVGYPVFRYAVSPGYFELMGIPLRHGRLLDAHDVAGVPLALVISESLAKSKFGDQNPIGQLVHIGPTTLPSYTIVGVVGDVKQASLVASQTDAVYMTASQWPFTDNAQSLVIRSFADTASFAPAIRNAIRSVDKDQPVVRVATMNSLLAASAAERRFVLILFEAFALVALILAAIGIYGVLSGSVTERTHEIGVRLALGARRWDVLSLILGQVVKLTLSGVGIGLLAAMAATRLLTKLLYGVSATDPLSYGGVALLLITVALLACYLPARRATKVDPMIALRYE